MVVAPFDTLKNAGFTDEQSEAIVVAIRESLGENLVTKSDLEVAIAELRADIYRALWIQGGGLVMIMVALFTLFRAF